MAEVVVRYWAGAARAAGRAQERVQAGSVGEIRAQLAVRRDLAAVVAVASFLVDGARANDATELADAAVVDVLPPFAGGSSDIR